MTFTVNDSIKTSLLKVGRNFEWFAQTDADVDGPPSQPSDGMAIGESVTCAALVSLRDDPSTKRTDIEVTADGSTVYEVTVAGQTASYDASGGDGAEDTIINELQSAVAGLGVSDVSADAVDTDSSGSVDTLRLTGDTQAGYEVSVSIGSGSGTITVSYEDASQAAVRLWAKAGGTGFGTLSGPPEEWVAINQAYWPTLDFRGITERLTAAGYDRLYAELIGADGDVDIYLARAIEE